MKDNRRSKWQIAHDEAKERLYEQRKATEHICLTFGCGKHLSSIEYLYSDYCFNCQQKRTQQRNEKNETKP